MRRRRSEEDEGREGGKSRGGHVGVKGQGHGASVICFRSQDNSFLQSALIGRTVEVFFLTADWM